ncbi:hypothetical protein CH259_16270 [Rhodococcus sp. 05-2254-4]|nr:hypothetical protein CH259_16270 [Rhodococcus sp. 05-2254-4]OZE48012.1 hypothetical protein CH261_08865 [Rhodococcus sp. 05-2254-3]OZE49223.1 hypothetical protein CH283_16650 [Rhodococcus sp. 05-2254-2]
MSRMETESVVGRFARWCRKVVDEDSARVATLGCATGCGSISRAVDGCYCSEKCRTIDASMW